MSLIIFTFLLHSKSYSQLSGTFTIGAGGNYATVNSAVSSLVANGVNGPVVFNIMTGIYNEVIIIDSVKNTSFIIL